MKTVGKFFAKKLASLLVLLLVLGIGIFWFRNSILAWFQGTHKVQYEFVIKKFEAESKLVVAGAQVETTANQTLENLLNLNSEEKLEVEIEVADLNFQIVDKK
ncbi:hypothetical protein [Streptococcus suis]|uniref:hypothetical protein n=1 Tax=Streptococcus suis TaxID=1307 RepID=UPI000CF3CB9C|nr:hypothetical protein [Streptococcus suis]